MKLWDAGTGVERQSLAGSGTRGLQVVFSGDGRRAAGVVRFAAGETVKAITVRVRGDRLSGDGEFFRLKLARPTGATLDDAEGFGTLVRRQAG